ncbi:DNA-binding response regulator, partial [Bifidobacterium amazonense]|nr:DNA-binding response regulator [Bifidobacterium amazonense]
MGGNEPETANVIRIGVLDNDPFALDAMCAMIAAMSRDLRIVWSTGSPAVAIEHCHNAHTRPDVLVLDMALGGITGADVCRRIR